MTDIDLALNPPRFRNRHAKRPIRLTRSPSPVWPLPAINGREPVLLAPYNKKAGHIELAYPRFDASDAVATCPPNTPNGTDLHLMPPMTPVLTIDDGDVTWAGRHGDGFGVIVNHNNGWGSYYANLESIVVVRTDLYRPRDQVVRAGATIGYVGAPAPGAFKRLCFELWKLDDHRHFVPVDPKLRLAESKLVEHYDQFTPGPPTAQMEAA